MRRADLPLSDLQKLLADAFEPAELDRLVLGLPGAEAWRTSLPINSGSRDDHAARIVAFLLDRGRIDAALLQAVREARPGRAAEIEALHLAGNLKAHASPSRPLSPVLIQLRQAARDAANVLPGVFHIAGGPDALSEIAVELVLRPDPEACSPDALHPRSKERTSAFVRRHEGTPTHPFPLRDLLGLNHRRWMILGDPGGGKTTSLRRLVLHVVDETALVPLLLRIGEVHDVDGALDELVTGVQGDLWAAAADGQVVLLVDGLDEATDPIKARKALVSLSARLGPSLMVVTSRGATYEPVGGRLHELMLCPLSRAQQERLLRGWLPESRHAEIPGQLDGLGDRMARLAENPLILTLMARLLCAGQRLPRRRVDLYGEVLHNLLTRGHTPDLHEQQRPFDESAGPIMALGWLALHGHGTDSEQITIATLRARIRCAPQDVSEAMGSEPLDRWLKRVSAGAGLLEPDRTGANWSFAHRTFREYLAARALADDVARHGGVERCGINSELDRSLTKAKAKPALWAEVFALLTGLLTGGEPEALVKRLVEGGEDYKPLLFRVLADAEGLKEETVWGVLGLTAGRDEWEKRSEVLKGLPALVGDLGVAVKLLGRFGKAATHGADLWWAHHLLVEIAAGRLGEGPEEEARAEASGLADRLFREHRSDARREAEALIDANGWWKPIPAGRFRMGSTTRSDRDRYDNEGPQHEVELVRGFDLLAVPVTNALYDLFDPGHAEAKYNFDGSLPLSAQEQVPVYNVSWYEASAFASWLGCRLPSETEWEYACRGGTTTRFWSGSKDQDLFDVGWVDKNSGGHPHPVATPPKKGGPQHPWGLHDLQGNVWGWCVDPGLSNYQGRESGITLDSNHLILNNNPTSPRAVRGGDWGNVPRCARSACRVNWVPSFRDLWYPTNRYDYLGFRLLRPLPESS